MRGQTLVAVYRTRRDAEEARDRLRGLGVPEGDIELGGDERFLDEDALPNDRSRFRATLRDGRTAVCVRLRPEFDADRLVDWMEETEPLDVDEDVAPAPADAEPAAERRRRRVHSYIAEPGAAPTGHNRRDRPS